MSEDVNMPPVVLSEEQWAVLKQEERRRTQAQIIVGDRQCKTMIATVEAMERQVASLDLAEARRLEDKRDSFAAAALVEFSNLVSLHTPGTIDVVARLSYAMADAMMEARKQEGDQ